MFRPIRPNPLIPTFNAMPEMLGGAACVPRLARGSVGLRHLLKPAQPMIHRRLGEVHPPRKLAEVELRVLAPPPRHLAQGGRQGGEPAVGSERIDGRRLPEPRADRLADVRGLEVEPAVDLAADLAHDANVLELHHRAVGAHRREQADDPVAVLHVDHRLARTIADAHVLVGATNSMWYRALGALTDPQPRNRPRSIALRSQAASGIARAAACENAG